MLCAQPSRCRDFFGDRLSVDVPVIVAMRLEAEQPILPDLHEALGRGEQADNQRTLEPLECGDNGTPGTSGTFAVFTPRLAR